MQVTRDDERAVAQLKITPYYTAMYLSGGLIPLIKTYPQKKTRSNNILFSRKQIKNISNLSFRVYFIWDVKISFNAESMNGQTTEKLIFSNQSLVSNNCTQNKLLSLYSTEDAF